MKHWYRPRYRLHLDGAEWSADDHAAYRERAPVSAEDRNAARLDGEIDASHGAPVVELGPEIVGACAALGTNARVQAHHVRRAVALFGAVEWRNLGGLAPFVAFADGKPVALAMPVFGERGVKPACSWCQGRESRGCPDCDGTGIGSETEPAFEVSP